MFANAYNLQSFASFRGRFAAVPSLSTHGTVPQLGGTGGQKGCAIVVQILSATTK